MKPIWIFLAVTLLGAVGLLSQLLPFMLARYHAIRGRLNEVNLFGGLVKLILWPPNEGVICLRNKKVHFVDQSGAGGYRHLLPIKGDEIAARIPLAIRFLTWEDDSILSRESLQVHMKVVIWWKVTDIVKYVYDIDRSVHSGDDHNEVGLIESSETWLKAITESIIRVLVSRASLADLISTTATRYLRASETAVAQPPEPYTASTIAEDVAHNLHRELGQKVAGYGISVDRVEIQEVGLAPEVQEAINRVWLAHLKPVQSEQESRARQIELEATARVLGTDATALTEIMKTLQGTTFYGIPPFMQNLFNMVDKKSGKLDQLPPLPAGQEQDGKQLPRP